MSFEDGIRNVILDGTILRAECLDEDGVTWKLSKLHLDAILGNQNGMFQWRGWGFHHTAKNIYLEGSFLHADLRTYDDEYCHSFVDLDEHVTTLDGGLIYYEGEGVYSRRGQTQSARGVFVTTDEIHGPFDMDEEMRKRRDVDEATRAEARRAITDSYFEKESTYQYAPLSTARSIRLVKISPPTEQPDLVYCSLTEVDLDDPPPFAALSYTWGCPFPDTTPEVEQRYRKSMTISCDGKRMQVGHNLYEALCRLRHAPIVEPRDKSYHKTELIAQAENGSILDVERLLREGADVTARDGFGETALHYAAENGHILCVKALVYAGSDIKAVDDKGRTPLECAQQARRRFHEEVEAFLSQQLKWNCKIQRMNSCLRAQVADVEYYWVDALCINQSEDAEKSKQVAMMGVIYKAATKVVVWLGPTYHNWRDPTEKLLQGIWTLEGARTAGEMEDRLLSRMLNMFDNPNPYDVAEDEQDLASSAVKDWISACDANALFDGWLLGPPLFRRSWFSRAWILQEIFMARHVTAVCGSFIIPWDILIFMSSFIEGMRSSFRFKRPEQRRVIGALLVSDRSNRVPAVDLERRKRAFKEQGKLPMLNALSLTRNASAYDPRDKGRERLTYFGFYFEHSVTGFAHVFSALSFSNMERSTGTGREPIMPDYTVSVSDLYLTVSKSLVQTHGPCVLSLAGMRRNSGSPGLPSWAADLQVPLFAYPSDDFVRVFTEVLEKDKDAEYKLAVIWPNNELSVHAIVWDDIAEVTPTGLNDIGPELENLASWVDLVSQLNLAPEARQEILWRNLLEDPTEMIKNIDSTHFRDWLVFLCYTALFDLRDHLRSCVQSFSIPDIKATAANAIVAQQGQRFASILAKARALFMALGMPFEPNAAVPRWLRDLLPLEKENIEDILASEQGKQRICNEVWQLWEHMAPHAEPFGTIVRNKDTSRRLLRSRNKNMLGTAPEMAQVGDKICLVFGAGVPYVMRRREDGKYQHVGESYVHGVNILQLLLEGTRAEALETICIV